MVMSATPQRIAWVLLAFKSVRWLDGRVPGSRVRAQVANLNDRHRLIFHAALFQAPPPPRDPPTPVSERMARIRRTECPVRRPPADRRQTRAIRPRPGVSRRKTLRGMRRARDHRRDTRHGRRSGVRAPAPSRHGLLSGPRVHPDLPQHLPRTGRTRHPDGWSPAPRKRDSASPGLAAWWSSPGTACCSARPTSTTVTTSSCTSSPTSSTRRAGAGDGAPDLPRRSMYVAWARVLGRDYEELVRDAARRHRDVIDRYGATNPAEFFAVVTEVFFEKPTQLRRAHPELYQQMRLFYRQDPEAARR